MPLDDVQPLHVMRRRILVGLGNLPERRDEVGGDEMEIVLPMFRLRLELLVGPRLDQRHVVVLALQPIEDRNETGEERPELQLVERVCERDVAWE